MALRSWLTSIPNTVNGHFTILFNGKGRNGKEKSKSDHEISSWVRAP